jgi:hypothetical protein
VSLLLSSLFSSYFASMWRAEVEKGQILEETIFSVLFPRVISQLGSDPSLFVPFSLFPADEFLTGELKVNFKYFSFLLFLVKSV